MQHIPWALDLDPVAARIDVVVKWHTHPPQIREKDGVLYINPGSAGKKRFSEPVSMAKLCIEDDKTAKEFRAEIIKFTLCIIQ